MSTLYIVATPIGNLQDITLRAIQVMKDVDVIACEDTRHTQKLLTTHSITGKLMSCHANAEASAAEKIVGLLAEGKSVAYASDAGTPGFSDPGSVLVRTVRKAGFKIVPIPGPSAATALASVSGMRGRGFFFEGFLSPKKGRRRRRIVELVEMQEPFVLYESPFRVIKLLADLADICPERPILIGREMTKIHEEFIDGSCRELFERLAGTGGGERGGERGGRRGRKAVKHENVRGEFAILVGTKKKD